jgi:ABC-type lipoprotein release transport system permease subunit
MLFGISNLDPLAYLAALFVFAIAAALAVTLPAARALRIDPAGALRHE